MKIPTSKPSTIKINEHDTYVLEPATSRTHYESGSGGGGQPYAFPSRKSDGAWFVKSRISGTILGLLEEGTGEQWSFQKVQVPTVAAPAAVRAKYNDVPKHVYNVDRHLRTGISPAEAISVGLGVKHVPGLNAPKRTARSAARLDREIEAFLEKK